MKLHRYDRAKILSHDESDEGFLTVRAVVTKPGVYPYQSSDGTIQQELKHPEDIYSDLTIRSCNAKPVTDDHPSEAVGVDNIQALGRGLSHNDASVQNGGIMVSFTITDKSLIDKVLEGDKREISLGFMTDLVSEQGQYEGQNYQFRQTNVEVNHIAIVDQGRVGPEAAIRGDSSAWQVDRKDSKQEGGSTMAKVKIDEQEFEVPSEVKSKVDGLQAKADSYDQLKRDYDTLTANYDAQTTELDNKKTELDEAQKAEPKQDAIDAAVENRIALIDTAREHLPEDFEYKGKSDQDIKVAVIQTQDDKFDAKEKSEEYINARYDATMSFLQDSIQSSVGDNQMKFPGSRGDDINKKREDRMNMKK
ncbi:DUF2213 domain-containing protein [Salibacterium halotolerans]|uniref:DUF2213 domain-containing protein n=1 Tax=Salibacterium halotolerans TaxID=1884432 RepID=A0A1I5N9Y0_9BACI|nr:DUF2213 domain-containing protein [Salibacterium halotolerans]SFP18487.1 hypothetical protein SAMN05518683_10350 [Salibacterium halotolerans]